MARDKFTGYARDTSQSELSERLNIRDVVIQSTLTHINYSSEHTLILSLII